MLKTYIVKRIRKDKIIENFEVQEDSNNIEVIQKYMEDLIKMIDPESSITIEEKVDSPTKENESDIASDNSEKEFEEKCAEAIKDGLQNAYYYMNNKEDSYKEAFLALVNIPDFIYQAAVQNLGLEEAMKIEEKIKSDLNNLTFI